jgi:RNA polymerase sigma-70 factor (ECF subfamily)
MGPGQQDGDWRALWADYGPKLLLFARQQTPELGAAEDIVQEAFVRFWKSRQKSPDLRPSLLFTMVKRIAIDYARKSAARRWREAEAQALNEGEAFVEDGYAERDRREMLEASLRGLPEAQREVLVLKIWGDLTFDEIGRTLDVSPNTAASRYRYALNQLRGLLAPAVP